MISGSVGNEGTPLFNQNVKVVVPENTETAQTQQKETLEKQQQSLSDILNGNADTVEISDEARTLSTAARELAETEAAAEAQQNTTLNIKAPNTTTTQTINTPDSDSPIMSPTQVDTSSPIYGAEARQTTGDHYTNVLKDLRSKYSEEEAMQRFDEFMQSEGFELKPAGGAGIYGTGLPGVVNTPMNALSGWTMGTGDLVDKYGLTNFTSADNRLRMHSDFGVASVNGQTKYFAESTATFYAYNSDEVYGVMEEWRGQNADEFAAQAGFDVDAYRAAIGADGYTALVAVDRDLGSSVSGILGSVLEEEGFSFTGLDRADFALERDESGNVTGVTAYFSPENYEGYDEVLDKTTGETRLDRVNAKLNERLAAEIAADPSLLEGFVAMEGSVEGVDTDSLAGAYSDGSRGVSYGSGRSFALSAAEPDAMVMRDRLYVYQSGYTYEKKTDVFDPTADSVMLSVPHGWPGQDNSEVERVAQGAREVLEEAIVSGTQVKSEVDRETYMANRAGTPPPNLMDRDEVNPEVGIYDARTGKRIDNDPNWSPDSEEPVAEEVEEDGAADVGVGYEASYVDGKNETRRGAVEDLLARARAQNETREVDMLSGLLDSLRDFYSARSAEKTVR